MESVIAMSRLVGVGNPSCRNQSTCVARASRTSNLSLSRSHARLAMGRLDPDNLRKSKVDKSQLFVQ